MRRSCQFLRIGFEYVWALRSPLPRLLWMGASLVLGTGCMVERSAIAQDLPAPPPAPESALVGQVNSVGQLADVQPGDWAFQALESLATRYGCLGGYPDGTFRGDRALSRYEFAAGLNACIDRITQIVADGNPYATQEDLNLVRRLQEEFSGELSVLRGRVDQLEARTEELEARQFSTTTKLTGQVVVAVNDGGIEGDRVISPTGRETPDPEPNTTVIFRAALDLNTSFFGTDLLKMRIDTGSGGINDNAAAVLEPTFGSGLDFSIKPPSDKTFGLARLYYTFSPTRDVTVSVGPEIRTTDYIDFNSYANLSFRDFSTQALINNYILFPIFGPSAGATAAWNPNRSPWTFRVLYAATQASSPQRVFSPRGTAAFASLLYPTERASGGLFGDTYQGIAEVQYAPSREFTLRLQYAGGEVFDRRFDVVGANVEWTLNRTIGIFGRYGYGSYDDTVFGDVNPNYWMAGVAFRDLLLPGALMGIAAGQPFIESEIGNATQTNFEAFYNFPVNANLRVTPLVQVITNPANRDENGTIVTGTVRTVLSF